MIHAYHVIFGAYGFWLPNDPRGSWSDFVGRWELTRFGRSTKSLERHELTAAELRQKDLAKLALRYPIVRFDGHQARSIATGFAKVCERSNITLWACAILPEHVHLVIARHHYKVENIVGLLKGEATKQLRKDRRHPLDNFTSADGIPTPWAQRCWKQYLEDEQGIEAAIHYVNENPMREHKPRQNWSFVTLFCGIEKGAWITYH